MDAKILVVEDEERLRSAINMYFQAEGFTVLEAADGPTALNLFSRHKPDLVLLDVMLPGISGFDVCKSIRLASPDVPILFLTALSDDDSHMLGYRLGADDYIAKPFKVSILAMKVRRILSKRQTEEKSIYSCGPIVLDTSTRFCHVDGKEIHLTSREFDLLLEFLKNIGRVLTREYLLNTIWGADSEFDGGIRVVDAMVKKLRKKLGPAADAIKTVISVGYKLEDAS